MSNGINYQDFLNRICSTWDSELVQKFYNKYNLDLNKPIDLNFFIETVEISLDDKMWVLLNSKFISEEYARKLAYLYADRAVQKEKNNTPLVLENLRALYNKIYNDSSNNIEDLRVELYKDITNGQISLSKKFYESSLAVYNAGLEDFEKAASEASNSGRRILRGTVIDDEYEFQINLYKNIIKI